MVEEIVMRTDQPFLPEGSASDPKSQVSLQTSAEFECTYNVQIHKLVDAIAAAAINAQAGLNWLRAEPPDLERVRQALNNIANDGQRAAENVARLRALTKKMRAPVGSGFSSSGS
ncbi:hypothetical protein AC629_35025 [Bradyrhizobium sp. NAS80.1]|uniref:hypothetical protein n=1 Tax=Bradyrhizobium sp. NAS80.1 TaxID=1680159 RepID=UPI000962CBED|nr:hypothetical protein [Bradyrhizobium sp. NAS80.1]OKO74447.1 hypothetical protein AC629_35025 [Bradyrhizobium sp. NAS80.1]